jgi:uncharacterized membrane protein (UPF0182 family)
MGRDIVDIPEVFRKAFEEEDWDRERDGGEGGDGGNGGNGGNGGQGEGGRFERPWWLNRWAVIGLAIIILLLSFNWIVTTYTEWLWFRVQDFQRVWLTQWLVRVAVFVVFFITAATVLLINWRLAYRRALRARRRGAISLLRLPGVRSLVTAGALFMAFLFAVGAAAQWGQYLLYLFRQPFGTDDPIFGLDLGFYLFDLPVYRSLHGWFVPLFVFALGGAALLYVADSWRGLRQGVWRPVLTPSIRRHLAILAAIVTLLWAVGYWLDIYELMYSARGVAFGASYTDLNATRPALYAQLAATIVLAIAVGANAFRRSLRPLVISGGLWLVVSIAMGVAYPSFLQRYVVEPNELSKERPYIQNNIDFTRLAFGLDKIDARPFGDVSELTNQDLLDNEATLQNVRIWDDRPLQQTYAQLQELRPYYQFSSIDIDRYQIEGETRQVMLAARELNKSNLSAPSWVNQKLQFTHGYGVVMNPVDQVTPEGQPEFFIQDLPPRSSEGIDVERPEIYYGQLSNDVVFVGSDLPEFDYPVGTTNANSSYEGKGGVVLSNFIRRMAFAVRFGETNLMLSEYITPETRVLMHRQILERVREITPFLAFDNDPYLVVADGRLFWILDGYTLSSSFPYSTPTDQGFNYIRNPIKVVVDAYDGSVTYYLIDQTDPLIRAYNQAFPGLFQPLEEMPEELVPHLRYPKDLFSVQTRQYLKYHMTDTQVFYNQEDLWEIPLELFDTSQQPIEPYYVMMSLPGEERTEFLLIEPYTPAGKDNMIAWLAARSDMPHYGELVAFELPKQQLVFGPSQVEARVDQDPEISAQISLWNQRGSRVIRGNLIVIPMGTSFLYVEPLYLLAETSELPELKRVIVASGDRLAMRETLEEALVALIEAGPTVTEAVNEAALQEAAAAETASPTATPGAAPVIDETMQALIDQAGAHFAAAEQAQREGDWATYGQELEALGNVLEQLQGLSGGG